VSLPLGSPRQAGARGSPALRSPAHRHLRVGPTPPSPGRCRPPPVWCDPVPGEWPCPRARVGPCDWRPAGPRQCARCLKKNTLSYCRPTGRLDPTPAALASGSLALAALESQARRGERILLSEDETIVWRFALPRLGWGRRPPRYRLPTRPLRQGQISQEDRRKWQAWVPYRSWSRISRGVLLNVIGAVPYGTTQVCYQSVPPCDAQELRPYLPPSRDGSLQQNGPSSGAGRRPQWEPPGA
jgi:hypothetical protein